MNPRSPAFENEAMFDDFDMAFDDAFEGAFANAAALAARDDDYPTLSPIPPIMTWAQEQGPRTYEPVKVYSAFAEAISQCPYPVRMLIAGARGPLDRAMKDPPLQAATSRDNICTNTRYHLRSSVFPIERHSLTGWSMAGVLQRVEDAGFSLSLPLDASPSDGNVPEPHQVDAVQFCIAYDPASDDCEFTNSSAINISLESLGIANKHVGLAAHCSRCIGPGLWRISAGAMHLADFLLREKQFAVSVLSTQPSDLSLWPRMPVTAVPTLATSEPSQQYLSLLDLAAGTSVLVRSGPSNTNNDTPTTAIDYRLDLMEEVSSTATSRFFICKHSNTPALVVAKILKEPHGAMKSGRLLALQLAWKKEVALLLHLNHNKNFVNLFGFDGRLHVLYFEFLPNTVQPQIPLSRGDCMATMRDLCSALAYLRLEGVVHNSINPANIVFVPGRGALLRGLEHATPQGKKSNRGMWAYFPPEFRTGGNRDHAGDVWAVAVTMLRLSGLLREPPSSLAEDSTLPVLNDEHRDCRLRIQFHSWMRTIKAVVSSLSKEDKFHEALAKALCRNPEERSDAYTIFIMLESALNGPEIQG